MRPKLLPPVKSPPSGAGIPAVAMEVHFLVARWNSSGVIISPFPVLTPAEIKASPASFTPTSLEM